MSTNSPFHSSEAAVQNRYGLADVLAERYSGFIRPAMPAQHRRFFESQSMMIVGLTDRDGNVWTLPVFGAAGFVSTVSDTLIEISTSLALASLIEFQLEAHSKIGLLGIELHSRRRNRVNGVIREIQEARVKGESITKILIEVDQSYGNCPQYIHSREFDFNENLLATPLSPDYENLNSITPSVESMIAPSDTFFIASRTKLFSQDPRTGIDASHRGGMPGFVKVVENSLVFPDFSGNKFFNTIGNIEDDGRVGLFFPNFENGNVVFISGTAKVLWDESLLALYEGAERFIHIDCLQIVYAKDYMPVTAKYLQTSPSFVGDEQWR